MSQSKTDSYLLDGILPLAGRVLLSAIFLISGVSKITAASMTIGYIQSVGLPFPQLALAIAVLIEIGGGLALIVGYRTRLVAALIAAYCLATAFSFHTNFADPNQFFHFFKNIAMTGGLLQVVGFGSGRMGLDQRRR